jgi:hypothetical protein
MGAKRSLSTTFHLPVYHGGQFYNLHGENHPFLVNL